MEVKYPPVESRISCGAPRSDPGEELAQLVKTAAGALACLVVFQTKERRRAVAKIVVCAAESRGRGPIAYESLALGPGRA